jgi:hypothetical protein
MEAYFGTILSHPLAGEAQFACSGAIKDQPGAIEYQPGAKENHPGAMEDHPGAMEDHPGAMGITQ